MGETTRRPVNQDKAYSDIGTLIERFYGGHEDGELAALKIAGLALGVAMRHVEPVNVEAVTVARATVWRLISERQAELERRELEAQGGNDGAAWTYDAQGLRVYREPQGWTCTSCHTGNGAADRHCVSCGRRRA